MCNGCNKVEWDGNLEYEGYAGVNDLSPVLSCEEDRRQHL